MFESLKPVAMDPILGLMAAFRADTRTNKIDLGVGVYMNDLGLTPVMTEEGGGANNAADSAEKPNEDGAAKRVEDADEMEPDESSKGNATPVNRTAVNRPSHCKLNWGDMCGISYPHTVYEPLMNR